MKTQRRSKKGFYSQRAQSIIELAILGGLVLMILGLIIRYGFILAHNQNAQYEATRMALKMSATTFDPDPGTFDQKADRANASVLWINDKPTAEGGEKYGSTSRTPFMAFGSGTMTNMANYSLDYPASFGADEWANLPVFDVFINGEHFVFRTAGFRQYGKDLDTGQIFNNLIYTDSSWGTSSSFFWDICDNYPERCLSRIPENIGPDWHNFTFEQLVFYTKIPKTNIKFCYDPWNPHMNANGDWKGHHCGDDPTGKELVQRFNLRRKDGASLMPGEQREMMQWQWFPVHASEWGLQPQKADALIPSFDVDFDGKEEQVMEFYGSWMKSGAPCDYYSGTTNMQTQYEWGTKVFSFTEAGSQENNAPFPLFESVSWFDQTQGHCQYPSKCEPPQQTAQCPQGSSPNSTSCPNGWMPCWNGSNCQPMQSVISCPPGTSTNWFLSNPCISPSFFCPSSNCAQISSSPPLICGTRTPSVVTVIKVLDYQAGDMDMTYDKADELALKPRPGLVSGEGKITTISSGSLVLDQKVQSGKVVKDSRQKRDSLDIIERKIQLSNNTGCFCPVAPNANAACFVDAKDDRGYPLSGKPAYCQNDNLAVQAACSGDGCCDAVEENRRYKTCFQYDKNLLYVRTIFSNREGVKFVTQD